MLRLLTLLTATALVVAGHFRPASVPPPASHEVAPLETVTALDTVIVATVEAAGIAAPIQQAKEILCGQAAKPRAICALAQ